MHFRNLPDTFGTLPKNCTMEDPLDYQFAWENIQVIGETQWEEIGP